MIEAQDIAAAARRIQSHVRRTPVIDTEVPGCSLPVTFKLEFLQHTASFKPRGVFANLLGRELPKTGVAAASGGNHGAAVAYAASKLGTKARIFVPMLTTPAKAARIRSYGADLVQDGANYQIALANCDRFAAETGALAVHAYNSRATLLGQGTLAFEFEDQAPGLDTVLVAVGGGGLIGGMAAWYRGRVKVVGVEPETCQALHAALAAGAPETVSVSGIAADSLGASRVGDIMFPLAQAFVDQVALVSDKDIRNAQRWLWEHLRIVAEPGGAAALAALLSGSYQPAPRERAGVVLCGANTEPETFAKVIAGML
jgi:threonine dehydratase